MPLLNTPYLAPRGFASPHIQTVFPKLRRRVRALRYRRERLELADGDFLDLDWLAEGARAVSILCHGLESSSNETCMRGLARALAHGGHTVLALNFRGCGGEANRLLRSYHAGVSEDLALVVEELSRRQAWERIFLVGVSLGGNVVLKYLGELGARAQGRIAAAAAISVPCDLAGSARQIAAPANFIYLKAFMDSLKRKLRHKLRRWPGSLEARAVSGLRNFEDFDEFYTAPVHGFGHAADYYRRCSSASLLAELRVPTLLINSRDDPFLVESCFPFAVARASRHLHLLAPDSGGHVGFVQFDGSGDYWHERQVVDFFASAEG